VGAWIETWVNFYPLPYATVAPRVGAWIETALFLVCHGLLVVAPRVGAWIETVSLFFWAHNHWSRPAWARGLKHVSRRRLNVRPPVAPRVGAWIETFIATACSHTPRSRPAWARFFSYFTLDLRLFSEEVAIC